MKKILLSISFLIAVILSISLNINSFEQKNNLSFSNIEALANNESGGMANKCCPIWNITYTTGIWPTISCTTGGSYKCENCTCPK